jgi:hypothetical protein
MFVRVGGVTLQYPGAVKLVSKSPRIIFRGSSAGGNSA